MTHEPPTPILDRLKRPGVLAAVVLMHLGVFLVVGRSQPMPPTEPQNPPFDVILFRPEIPTPEPEPPPPEPARESGGGAPAAPSRVHVPPVPTPQPPELPAPPVQAPEPAPVVGVAPTESPTPGQSQGGTGTGAGTGSGSGDGPGAGTPPRFVRGPSQAQILREYPRAALEARQAGRGVIACRIRLDTRLDGCRIVEESPPGAGFGRAALAAAAHFRFRPPTRAGAPVEGQEVTLGVDFMPRR